MKEWKEDERRPIDTQHWKKEINFKDLSLTAPNEAVFTPTSFAEKVNTETYITTIKTFMTLKPQKCAGGKIPIKHILLFSHQLADNSSWGLTRTFTARKLPVFLNSTINIWRPKLSYWLRIKEMMIAGKVTIFEVCRQTIKPPIWILSR